MSASTVKPMKRPGGQSAHEPTRTTRLSSELTAMKRGMALHTLKRASVLLARSEFKMSPAQAEALLVRCVHLLED